MIKEQEVVNKRTNERLGDRGTRRARPRYQDVNQPARERVPEGRWKHDKYEKPYSGRRSPKRDGGTTSRSATDIVKLNITNLPETVNKFDLQELLDPYPVMGIEIRYNESDHHLGKADVFVKRYGAMKICGYFRRNAIDGHKLKIFITEVSADVYDRFAHNGSKYTHELSGYDPTLQLIEKFAQEEESGEGFLD